MRHGGHQLGGELHGLGDWPGQGYSPGFLRVSSVLRQLASKGHEFDGALGLGSLSQLTSVQETAVLTQLAKYPEVIALAGGNRAPHTLVHYLRDLANSFHTYYNAEQFIVEDAALRNARLSLVLAVQQVVRNGLGLLGVSAPETR